MTLAIRRLTRLAGAPPMLVAAAVGLGAVTVLLGVGLMATAGYLISRAAEQPPILSLTVAIVGVRAFGLTRPVARYLDRLVSHDLALRALGRARVHAYERIEPLAPAGLEEYRDGDLLARMVADVDALQGLYLHGLGPPLVAGAVALGALTVLGAWVTSFLAETHVSYALALSAGVTVYVAASDLIPEVNREGGPALAWTVFGGLVFFVLADWALGQVGR